MWFYSRPAHHLCSILDNYNEVECVVLRELQVRNILKPDNQQIISMSKYTKYYTSNYVFALFHIFSA